MCLSKRGFELNGLIETRLLSTLSSPLRPSLVSRASFSSLSLSGRVPPAFVVPGGRRAGPEGLQREAAQVPRGTEGGAQVPRGYRREAVVKAGLKAGLKAAKVPRGYRGRQRSRGEPGSWSNLWPSPRPPWPLGDHKKGGKNPAKREERSKEDPAKIVPRTKPPPKTQRMQRIPKNSATFRGPRNLAKAQGKPSKAKRSEGNSRQGGIAPPN